MGSAAWVSLASVAHMETRVDFDEETNALDYLDRSVRFLREVEAGDVGAWKWVAIALHGAVYGFAVAAARGTDWHRVTYEKKDGTRRLLNLDRVLGLCENPQHMKMLVHSKPLVMTDAERKAVHDLSKDVRNEFEHFIPKGWVIHVHGLPLRVFLVLKVAKFLALETNTYVRTDDAWRERIGDLVQEGYDICNRLRTAYLAPKGL